MVKISKEQAKVDLGEAREAYEKAEKTYFGGLTLLILENDPFSMVNL